MENILINQNQRFVESVKSQVNNIRGDICWIKQKAEALRIKHKFDHIKTETNNHNQINVSSDEEYYSQGSLDLSNQIDLNQPPQQII